MKQIKIFSKEPVSSTKFAFFAISLMNPSGNFDLFIAIYGGTRILPKSNAKVTETVVKGSESSQSKEISAKEISVQDSANLFHPWYP